MGGGVGAMGKMANWGRGRGQVSDGCEKKIGLA